MSFLLIVGLVGLSAALLFHGRAYWAWVAPGALALAWWASRGPGSPALHGAAAGVFAALALVSGVPALRRRLVSAWVMPRIAGILPRMGETERIALEAGTVWWDGDLFSGDPGWEKLLAFALRPLSAEERAFLGGPVEELCRMVNEWEVVQRRDLRPEVWSSSSSTASSE
jgi:acyl-CoA dehydrogenase